jgi:glucose/mannose transport system substrate-binding protein
MSCRDGNLFPINPLSVLGDEMNTTQPQHSAVAASISKLLGCLIGATLTLAAPAQAAESVEVLHWYTSGGETAAAAKIKEALSARGVEWKDAAVAGADNARTLLRTRVGKGSPPDAAQVTSDLRSYAANTDSLANLDAVAGKGKWDEVLPESLRRYAKMGGKSYVAVPINVQRQNLMWISTDGLKRVGASAPPKSWDEFFAMADKAKAAGMVPLAMGEDIWVNFTFMAIVIGTMQPDAFRQAFYDLDETALKGPGMVKAFEVMRKLRSYTDRGASSRKWNEATQMMVRGQAFAQIMGDWAKGELSAAGKKPNVDYVCTPVPGSGASFLFTSNSFLFFKRDAAQTAAQLKLAEVLMDKTVQSAFSLAKGSIPARTDADLSAYDECAKQSYADFISGSKTGAVAAQPQMLQPAARMEAWRDVVLEFWNDDGMTPQKAAERMLAAARK